MAWWTLSNIRSILTTETDANSPGSQELFDQIRENIECILMLTYDTGESGTFTKDAGEGNLTDAQVDDGSQSWDADEHNDRTLLITSGSAIGNMYTIDDTAAGGTLTCTGDDLATDGVAAGDTYKILYDIIANTDGHDHDGINSANVVLADASITEAKYGPSSVDRTAMKTSSATEWNGDIANSTLAVQSLNDYCFFPQIYCEDGVYLRLTGFSSSADTTEARFGIYNSNTGTAFAAKVQYRYITATDKPFIMTQTDKDTGLVISVWAGEDPPEKYWGLTSEPEDFDPPVKFIKIHSDGSQTEIDYEVKTCWNYPLDEFHGLMNKHKRDNKFLHRMLNDYDYDSIKKIFKPKNLTMI